MAYTSRIFKNSELTQIELDNNFLCHWPIGSIYMNALNDNSPGDIIGYGNWSLFAQGYTLLSANSPRLNGDDGFGDSPREIEVGGVFEGSNRVHTDGYYSPGFYGGSPSVKVTEIPRHDHSFQGTNATGSFIEGAYRGRTDYNGFYDGNHHDNRGSNPMQACRIGGGNLSFSSNSEGALGHNNLQRYITVNIWKRDS